MQLSPGIRHWLALGLWGGFLVCATWQLFRHEAHIYPGYYAPIVPATEQRMLPARGPLLGTPVVGYVSDVSAFPPDVKGQAIYYLTQYALVPTLVDREGTHPLAVANLLTSTGPEILARQHQWEPVQDLGEGVILVRRRQP